MAGLGSVFVELQLDRSKFDRSLQQLERDATSSPVKIEDAFRNMGIKSSYQFDLMRQKAEISFQRIKMAAEATENDKLRAAKAYHDQVTRLNAEQFGQQTSMLQTLKANWLAASAAIYAAIRVAGQAWNMASEAADFQERVNSLEALGKQAGMTGKQILESMQTASRGLLSMKEAADLSASALNLNLSADQMIRFTKVSEALTDVIGGSIPEAFNRLTVAAASGRTQTLAQMGILIDLDKVYEQHAASVNKTVKELDDEEKQRARLNAILAEAEKKTAVLGEAVDTAADKMQRAKVIIADLTLWVGTHLANAFVHLYDVIDQWRKGKGTSLLEISGLEQELSYAERLALRYGVSMEAIQRARQQAQGTRQLPDTRAQLEPAARRVIPQPTPAPPKPPAGPDLAKAADDRRKYFEKLDEEATKAAEAELAALDKMEKAEWSLAEETKKAAEAELAAIQRANDERIKNYAESYEKQEAMLLEAEELGKKFLDDESKREQQAAADDAARRERALAQQQEGEEEFQRESRAAWGYYWQSVAKSAEGTYDRLAEISKQFGRTITNSLDDLFFNVLTGRFKSFSDWLQQLWAGLARTLSGALAQSLMSGLTGSGGGIVGLAQNIVSGVGGLVSGVSNIGSAISTGISTVGKFLGFLDVGMWSVPGGKSGTPSSAYGGRWKLPSETIPAAATSVAVLHPGEMVVPPDLAELIRRAVAAAGGSTGFRGLSELLAGGGRGGTTSAGGQYGPMSAAERSSLSSFGMGLRGMGTVAGYAGAPALGSAFGFTAGMISLALGFDAVRGQLGIDPERGYVGPPESYFTSIRDYEGVYAEAAARAAAEAAAAQFGALQAAEASFAADVSQLGGEPGGFGPGGAETGTDTSTGGFGPGGAETGSDTGSTDTDTGGFDSSASGADGGYWASGGLFQTRGRTRMTVGEAGTETVAVLRNPRAADLGVGGVTINLYNSGVIGQQLPDNLVREIQRELDRRASRRIRY